MTSEIAAGPVRFDSGNGGWQDTDTSLQVNGDGSISPVAFGEQIVLSGGGKDDSQAQDLLTVGSGKSAITWQWNGAVPQPTVKANTATYSNIEPGVDLVVAVRPTGVEQYFVLRTRPSVAPSLDMPLKVGGDVAAATGKNGDILFTGGDGSVLARIPSASMWSASDDVTVPESTPQPVPLTLDSSGTVPTLDLSLTLSALQDANLTYPLVIDPGISLGSTYDTWVNAGSTGFSGGTAATDSVGPLSGSATRTFLNWDDSAIVGTDVTAATLNLYNNTSDSPANTWQIWRTGLASSSTTWANQPSWTATDETTSAGNGASAGWVSTNVLATAQAWASGTATSVGMGLRTSPETGSVNQMTFNSINSSGNYPYISVTYDHYPNTPENFVLKDQHAFGSAQYANTTTPTFSAYVTDPDGGTENAAYTLTDTTTSTVLFNKSLGSASGGDGTSTYTVSGGSALTSGHSYQLQVWGYDGTAYSLNNQSMTFTVDASAPSTPTIASTTYTSNTWASSSSGTFTFSDPANDVQTWYYSFNGGTLSASGAGTCTTSCSYSPTLTPPAGWNTLKVWAMDESGNISSAASYTFGADSAGTTSPQPDQVVSDNHNVPLAGNVPLDGNGPYAATQVKFQYQLDVTSGTWSDIPASDVKNNGTTVSSWPVATLQLAGGLVSDAPQLTGGGPALSWNVASTLAGLSDTAESQPIYVRAVFSNTGGSTWTSPHALMTYESQSADNGDSTLNVGPCTVSLWTGSCEIDDRDVAVQAPNFGSLGLDRTYISDALPSSGPLGPGWSTDLPTDAADMSTVTDTGGLVTIDGANSTVTFVPNGSGYSLSEGEAGEQTLTKSGTGASTVFTFSEPADASSNGQQSDTQQISFSAATQPTGGPSNAKPWVYRASTLSPTGPAGSAQRTQITYNAATGYPKQILAPQPAGATCNTTWVVGCEALNFTYSANNEITNVTLETTDASGSATNTDVACYKYNASSLLLLQEWDPRTSSSSCNFSSPVLPTTYTYSSGRVVSVSPPGLATWSIAYSPTTGQVNNIHRAHSSTYGGATQQTSFVYNAPIGSTTSNLHPDLSSSNAATWGQYDDAATATAVFGPGTTSSGTDLRAATIYGMDASGYLVNQADFDGTTQADWDVSTTQYDQYGNEINELSPQDRAWVIAATCTKAGLSAGCPQAILADGLSSVYKYTSDGISLRKSYGPTSPSMMTNSGRPTVGRPVSSFTYGTVNYPTVTPSDYSTDGPLGDITQEVDGLSEGAGSVETSETDQETTNYSYGLNSTDSAGWDYGTPESTTTVLTGGNIVHQSKIDDATGRTLEVRQPSASGTSASPATTTYSYYTAGTKNIANCVNNAWVGAVCTIGPGAQPGAATGMPGLPVTQVTNYDYLLRPLTIVGTVNDASGVQQTRTTTTSYDNGGIANRVLTTSLTGGVGAATPSQTYYYDSTTGLPSVLSGTAATNCSSAGPLCASYDDFGEQTSFTDTTGATTVTAPSITGEPSTITIKTPTGTTIQTATYSYAAGNEHRDLLTSIAYVGGTGFSTVGTFAGSYNPDGLLVSESLPDGTQVQQSEDPQGNVIQRSYQNSTTLFDAEVDLSYNSEGQIAQELRPDIENAANYTFDTDNRLTKSQDVYYDGQCTTRTYSLDVDSNRTNEKVHPPATGGGCSTATSTSTQTLNYDAADRITSSGSASGISYDAFGRITGLPSSLVSGGGSESLGYFNDDKINTLTQGSTTQTWALDPAARQYSSTQSGSPIATVNHYGDFVTNTPTWATQTDGTGATVTSVDDVDLSGELAVTTADGTSTAMSYVLTDPMGNSIGSVNAADPFEVVTPVLTDDFGTPVTISGVPVTGPRYGWLGGYQIDGSSLGGIDLMGVRGYLPSIGRFLTVDSVQGGNDNPYAYPLDPIDRSDPSGLYSLRGAWNTVVNHTKSAVNWAENEGSKAAGWVAQKAVQAVQGAASFLEAHGPGLAKYIYRHPFLFEGDVELILAAVTAIGLAVVGIAALIALGADLVAGILIGGVLVVAAIAAVVGVYLTLRAEYEAEHKK